MTYNRDDGTVHISKAVLGFIGLCVTTMMALMSWGVSQTTTGAVQEAKLAAMQVAVNSCSTDSEAISQKLTSLVERLAKLEARAEFNRGVGFPDEPKKGLTYPLGSR